MTNVEFGAVREVWFAPVDDPGDKDSFLIRDDAYSKREATFSRSIRLGEPVDLGPFGGWRQVNWSGGADQDSWRDDAMFSLGTADVSERKGLVKLWNGYKELFAYGDRPRRSIGLAVAGPQGQGEDSPVFTFEQNFGTPPANSWVFRKFLPLTGALTTIKNYTTEPRASVTLGSLGGQYLITTFRSGDVENYNVGTGAIAVETPSVGGGYGWGHRALCNYNGDVYGGRGPHVLRRTQGVWTVVATLPDVVEMRSFVVWNNRVWFLGLMPGGKTALYLSDGYTVQQALMLPTSGLGVSMCAHYGSLYIRTHVDVAYLGTRARQQIWRYNGASVTLLFEDDESDTDSNWVGNLESWGRFLVWPKHGTNKLGRQAGVWLYDAEEDAIYMGPTIPMHPDSGGVFVTCIQAWNNSLIVAFLDEHTYSVMDYPVWLGLLNKTARHRSLNLDGSSTRDVDKIAHTTIAPLHGESFDVIDTDDRIETILSSDFDGSLPGERKTWVKGFIKCRVPEGCQVRLVLLYDDLPEEHPIQTVTYDASLGDAWQSLQFPATCETHGVPESSTKVRYKLYVENLDPVAFPNNTPEVDTVGLDFMPSPSKRSQYHIRCVVDADQERLGGDPNPLATREQMVNKLTEYWESGTPVLFWEPRSDGSEPADASDARTVLVQDFLEQTYRLTSTEPETFSEVTFNLIEVA